MTDNDEKSAEKPDGLALIDEYGRILGFDFERHVLEGLIDELIKDSKKWRIRPVKLVFLDEAKP